jgi:hypothetical protein
MMESLADAYLIIAHYLHHTAEIDSHLSGQRAEAVALRQSSEQRFDSTASDYARFSSAIAAS